MKPWLVILALASASALPTSVAAFLTYVGVAGLRYVWFEDLYLFAVIYLVATIVFSFVYGALARRHVMPRQSYG
ncbi:MAG: hypothetical protein QXD61_06280 [Candidatus Caldarchaeum sp.]